ncbi:uncharacterized protein LOC108627338 [Ceratina calcarata]|uniref:Uncharacterized protein LOC108627338 n=1 Tax=Ceratina calcarata TaxID=156304 RepID=A0AAJ7J4S9_9HYME|nr:uncharacterized protein LOC108627338 [Ceratina calcarata]
MLPTRSINPNSLCIPENIELADPEYYRAGEIDALIGSALFYNLLKAERIELVGMASVILQNTDLGWIVIGEVNVRKSSKPIRACHLATCLDAQISKFWTMEEIPERKILSTEERECEAHFTKHISRNEHGRYIVRLPFNDKLSSLGDSKQIALKRFYNLERKLESNIDLKNQYTTFLKAPSSTTKIRVVFDASTKGNSGLSLNDTLLIDPTIQDTLFSILIRFLQHTFVLTADIEKMYRQILVHPVDRTYKKFFGENL